MKTSTLAATVSASLLCAIIGVGSTLAASNAKPEPTLKWATVVNNNDLMPPLALRNFNSYNQPSVNLNGLVVFRARSRGGRCISPRPGMGCRPRRRSF